MTSDMEKKRLRMYVHVPFCQRKCAYCDFLSAPADEGTKERYKNSLINEIKIKSEAFHSNCVPSVFFGGGTPSVLDGAFLAEVLETIYASFCVEKSAEITIECNPGTLNKEKITQYKKAGINRVSLGLQSAHNRELRLLGRIHSFEDFMTNYGLLREAGFDNINVDLMSGLPGQCLEDWMESLERVTALAPEHISAYSLIIEEGTPFYQTYGADSLRREAGEETRLLPSEETDRQMYERTGEHLEAHGYLHYEISNYAVPGRECRHNLGYWKRENYLGLGLGSASLVENERFCNVRELEKYFQLFESRSAESWGIIDRQRLSVREQMEEFMFLGLRMMRGVAESEFLKCFGVEMEEIYGRQIAALCRQGLLKAQEGYVALTREGISVSNYVIAEFLE